MIGIQNRDSSYFIVKAEKVKEEWKNMTQNVISLTVTEEMCKMLSGSLSVYDPDNYYSNILRMGKPLEIEFGYQKNPVFFELSKDDQASGTFKRKGIRAIIQSPSGAGSETGVRTYNCNFVGRQHSAGISNTVYTSGNKSSVIARVMTELKVPVANQYINFRRGKEIITENTYVMQYESHFNFLRRLSFEWGATVEVSTNAKGELIAIFAEIGTSTHKKYSMLKAQVLKGDTMTFNYMDKVGENTALVKSYSWSQSGGGAGDNVQIHMVNGQPQFTRYNAKTDKTIVYKLKPEKMKAKLASQPDFSAKANVVKDWLACNDFDKLLKDGYFEASTETTAPQGMGLTINLKTLGNTMITCPMKAIFEGGKDTKNFPDIFKNGDLRFSIRKCTHTIDASGYNCDVEVVDTFTASGGSMVG